MATDEKDLLFAESTFELTRQLDWLDPSQPQLQIPIVVVGCGGIGSPTALCLAKEGFRNMVLIDDDTIEPHNLPNQMFPNGSLGRHKVDMLAALLKMFGDPEHLKVQVAKKKVQEVPELLSGVVVTGLDSMSARKAVWDIVRLNAKVKYLVDGRMGGLGNVIWAVDPNNTDHIDKYEEVALFDDSEGEDTACTARAIMDVAFTLAGRMSTQVRHIMTGKDVRLVSSYHQETDTTEHF